MLVESDSKVAVDMIQCGYTNISYLQPILADILYILQTPNLHLELHHIDREANKCADMLAHRAHYTTFSLNVMEFCFPLLDILICNDCNDSNGVNSINMDS